MKKYLKTTLLLTLVALVTFGCGQTTSTKNVKKTTVSPSSGSGLTGGGSTPEPETPTGIDGCPGVYRAGATRCYFTEIQKFALSGTSTSQQPTVPVNNVTIWSSKWNGTLPSSFDPKNFESDRSFSVRFKPTVVSSGSSQQGKQCSGPMAYNWSKVKLYFMLRRVGDSLTTIYEATADKDSYSSKLNLPTIAGATSEYVLEIMGVESNHRCNVYGSLSANEKTACTNGTFWGTIPLNQGGPTSCVGIKLEFSTDSTFDLP